MIIFIKSISLTVSTTTHKKITTFLLLVCLNKTKNKLVQGLPVSDQDYATIKNSLVNQAQEDDVEDEFDWSTIL